MTRIQIIAIVINFLFLIYTSRLIIRGRLREEYAIIWWVCAGLLLVFSIWDNGIEVIAHSLGVYMAPNLVFSVLIFIVLIYLLHLSLANSRLQKHITRLTQEIAIMKESIEKDNAEKTEIAEQ
ncbi:DUF2304 domain-containing protein [Niabella aquatica]